MNFRSLDSWIVIHEDSTATFYVGKTDGGQGTGTAFRQMMCDELGIVVVSLDYRKAPEHPYPAGPEDCYAGLMWTAAHASELEIGRAHV